MQSATNIKLGRKEDRSLMYVFHQTSDFYKSNFCPSYKGRVFIALLMYFVWVVMNVSVGSITKQQTNYRNTKKVRISCPNIFLFYLTEMLSGKYLLEREKLVKENAWTLDDDSTTTTAD